MSAIPTTTRAAILDESVKISIADLMILTPFFV